MNYIKIIFLFAFILLTPVQAFAQEDTSYGPLIQTTTFQSDFEAMVHLDLFSTVKQCEKDLQQAYENVVCSAVRIDVSGYYGSGSIFKITKEEMIIVSNAHVLEYWDENSFVTLSDGRVVSGTVMFLSADYDVGFLKIPIQEFLYEDLFTYRSVRSFDRNITEVMAGEEFLVIDVVEDLYLPEMYEGIINDTWYYIEEFNNNMLHGYCVGYPGMSGSGMFDAYGNYIGMVTGGNLGGELAGVPLNIILQEYKKAAS